MVYKPARDRADRPIHYVRIAVIARKNRPVHGRYESS